LASLNQTPSGERLHISIFGRRNSGKSSLINALTGQDIAIVSDVPGTTTDPVSKAMEILPLGPVVVTDTAGLDDVGELGARRVERSLKVLERTDLAILVLDCTREPSPEEDRLAGDIAARGIPLVAVANKCDLADPAPWEKWAAERKLPFAAVSAVRGEGINSLKGLLIRHAPASGDQTIVGDLVSPGDVVVLVTPIDQAAPKGRLILPQVMTIRDVLDQGALAVVTRERELKQAIEGLQRPPRLVITDSQAFLKAVADTPPGVLFTSFSILMARYRGDLEGFVRGSKYIDRLRPGSRVLIAEACTHHTQPDDIGKVQIPRWLRQYVGGELEFGFANGRDFPKDVSRYDLIIHCGSCMITRREVIWRQHQAAELGIPMTNYGVALAKVHGILERALEPFPLARLALDEPEEADRQWRPLQLTGGIR
jgi:[FeFe] hydrogenase H-cluster maturation GTPase HydF